MVLFWGGLIIRALLFGAPDVLEIPISWTKGIYVLERGYLSIHWTKDIQHLQLMVAFFLEWLRRSLNILSRQRRKIDSLSSLVGLPLIEDS